MGRSFHRNLRHITSGGQYVNSHPVNNVPLYTLSVRWGCIWWELTANWPPLVICLKFPWFIHPTVCYWTSGIRYQSTSEKKLMYCWDKHCMEVRLIIKGCYEHNSSQNVIGRPQTFLKLSTDNNTRLRKFSCVIFFVSLRVADDYICQNSSLIISIKTRHWRRIKSTKPCLKHPFDVFVGCCIFFL